MAATRARGIEAEISRTLVEADIDIGPPEFVKLLEEVLRDTRRPRIQADPASQLTEAEQAQLRRGGVVFKKDRGAEDRVRARTALANAVLMAEAATTGEAARRLHVDPSRIRQLLAERRLLAVRTGGEWRLLAVQFAEGGGLVPNIGQVIESLPEGLPPVAAASWLSTPEPDLEIAGVAMSPIEWLSAGGDPVPVTALAADL